MVKFYAGRIKRGKLTLEEVPEKWRADVEAYLAEESKDGTEPQTA